MSEPYLHALDLRHLRALRAVARAGSFHGAASLLGYTQSAISQQIKALEENVGHQLLERSGARSPTLPTDVGWVLLRHSDVIFGELDRAARELARLSDGIAGFVRIGYFQSVGAAVLPRIVRQVTRQMPDIELVLSESDYDLMSQAKVATGELDIAFVISPVTEHSLEVAELFDDPAVVVVRPDDPLAMADKVSLAALQDRTLATFELSAHQSAVDTALRGAARATISIRSNENATLAGVVTSGSAVAIMTRLSAIEAAREGLRVIELGDVPPRRVAVARTSDRPTHPAVTAMFNAIVSECAGVRADDFVPPAAPALRLLERRRKVSAQ